MLDKLLRIARYILTILLVKTKFKLVRGRFRIDLQSFNNLDFGKNIKIFGSIECVEGNIKIGDNFQLHHDSELACNSANIHIGDNVSIGKRSIISTSSSSIQIMSGTTFFSDCVISGNVYIGESCLFARNVTILSSSHQIYGTGSIRENDLCYKNSSDYIPYQKVTIEDDCWLGMNCVIMPGIELSKGVVVGANSVVTKSFPEYSIIAGVPAKIIGNRRNI
jgi:acetyltransferase-like isoleucine patch superfamily enzyme